MVYNAPVNFALWSKTMKKLLMGVVMGMFSPVAVALTAETALDGVTLPGEYVLLDHAKTTAAGPYINTQIIPDGTTSWELVMRYDGATTTSQHLMGSRIAFQNNAVSLSSQASNEGAGKTGFAWHYGNETYYSGEYPSHSGKQDFIVVGFTPEHKCEVDGAEKYTFDSAAVTTTRAIFLFTCNNNGNPHNQGAVMAVRRFRIWKNEGNGEVLKVDYVPARRVSDGKVGFYNLATGGFNLPENGKLTAGSEVVPVDPPAGDTELVFATAHSDRGTVAATVGGESASSGEEVAVGTEVALSATPVAGYEFAYWNGALPDGIDKTANPLNFAMPDKPVAITAYFSTTNCVKPAGWTMPTNGVLVLTFDDTATDTWKAQLDRFAQYNAHASFAVHGSVATYWSNLSALKQAGHTVGLHTKGHVNTDNYANRAEAYFNEQVKPQLDEYTAKGHTATYMAYPNNKHRDEIDDYILANSTLRHLRAAKLDTVSGIYGKFAAAGQNLAANNEAFTPVSELATTRILDGIGCAAYYGVDMEVLKAGIRRAAASNELMVVFSHAIKTSPENIDMTPEQLETILQTASEAGMRIVGTEDLPYALYGTPGEEDPEEPDEPDEPPVGPTEPEDDRGLVREGYMIFEDAYERLDYLEISTATPGFETDYLCKTDTRFRTKVAITSHPATNQRSRMGICGGGSQLACMVGAGYDNGQWKLFTAYGNAVSYDYGIQDDGEPHEYDLAPGSQTIDGTQTSGGTRTIDTDFPSTYTWSSTTMSPTIWLFKVHNNFGSSNDIIGKFYYAEISESGETIHRYYPVKRMADGVIGLYDEVTKVFTEVASAVAKEYEVELTTSRVITNVKRNCEGGTTKTMDFTFAPAATNSCSILYVAYGAKKGGDTIASWEHSARVGAVAGLVNALSVPWPSGAKCARWFWQIDGGGRLGPSDLYTSEVEYVASAGGTTGGYVNTGICPDGKTSYEVVAKWLTTSAAAFLLGSRENASSYKYSFQASTYDDGHYYWAGGYGNQNAGRSKVEADSTKFQTWSFDAATKVFKLDEDTIYDFTAYTWGVSGEQSSYPIYLLTLNNGGSPHNNRAKAQIKSFKLWKEVEGEKTLVGDYVPVRVGATAAFYDCVSGELKYSAGGTLTCGDDVALPEEAPATDAFFHIPGLILVFR